MEVEYNGIDLRVVRPDECTRLVKYDQAGRDYLGTYWRIAVTALFTPQVPAGPDGGQNLFVTAGAEGSPKVKGTKVPDRLPDALKPTQGTIDPAGLNHAPVYNSPVWTDAAVRHRLAQPQRKLRVTFASGLPGQDTKQLWLESPGKLPGGTEAFCDLDNGPRPQVLQVTDIHGDGRLFLVTFVVETTTNDCETGTDNDLTKSPLLSNQWTASLTYDEQYLATRTVRGVAVFRADAVQTFQKDPDLYRLDLIPPLPGNSKRYIDELTQHPDGYTYTYAVRDVEQALTYLDRPLRTDGTPRDDKNPRNVTVFDVEVTRGYEQQGFGELLPKTLNTLVNLNFANLGEGGDKGQAGQAADAIKNIPDPRVQAIAIGLDALDKKIQHAKRVAVKSALIANDALPQFTETVTVTVAGNRFAKMAELQYLAFSAAFGQVTTPLGLSGGPLGLIAGAIGEKQAGMLVTAGAGALAGALVGGFDGAIIGGIYGAGIAAAASPNVVGDAIKALATSNVYNVTYSPTRKQLQFTIVTRYGGLVDWVVGGTAGGWRAMTRPIADNVVGGDWPQSAKNNTVLSGNQLNPLAATNLPPIPDAGVELATPLNAPGLGPPVTDRGDGKKVMGTNMTAIIAQKLLDECQRPSRMATDAALTGNPGETIGFGILRASGRQLLP